jgi:hypothetical protein
MARIANSLKPRASAAWWLTLALAAVSGGLIAELGSGRSEAQVPSGTADRGQVVVVAGQVTPETFGLYLVDTDKRTILMYQWHPIERKLKLLAARNYSFDARLDGYNTTPPVSEVKDMVEQNKRLSETRPD